MALDFNSENGSIPSLETLVVQQLAEMLRQERSLQERYNRLDSNSSDEAEVSSFSLELSQFQDRASRLYRMMEAMDGFSSQASRYHNATLLPQ